MEIPRARTEWQELEEQWAARQRGDSDRRPWSEKMAQRLMDLRRIFGYNFRKETNGKS